MREDHEARSVEETRVRRVRIFVLFVAFVATVVVLSVASSSSRWPFADCLYRTSSRTSSAADVTLSPRTIGTIKDLPAN